MRRYLENLWHNWLQQRRAKALEFTLDRHNLYTFPGTSGLMYLGLTLILWLIGTNYQNNLILALAYGLVSLFIVAILHAYANLAGINICAFESKSVFAGEVAQVPLQLTARNKRGGETIRCQLRGQPSISVELNCQEPLMVYLPVQTTKRGWQASGRLLVESYYPLGLIRCWTWLHIDIDILVYPTPLAEPIPLEQNKAEHEAASSHRAGDNEFDGLKKYRPGDATKLIAWKALAKGRGLLSKNFLDELGRECWLDIDQLTGPIEHRLCVLTHWVVHLSNLNKPFGLRLNEQLVAPEQGVGHQEQCLKSLALFSGGGA